MSQITTHVLDTTTGRPAQGITVRLEQHEETIAQGVTNADGRIGDLLPVGKSLPPGDYRLVFETGAYFQQQNRQCFYPKVTVHFTITGDSHYHVPLLLSPFGYSTYRGS